ncbi:MAG: hypothetical protein ACP5PJ_09370, partial [Acidimicrobiales bacterium]
MSTQRSGGRIVVLSCHSEWVFDFDRQRFLRLPLGERNRDAHRFGSEGWQPFHDVEFETDTPNFVVYLNSDRSHLLRSYRHVEPCP